MWVIYSYKGFTISHNSLNGLFYITYPNEIESSIYCMSLDKAYCFIDEMAGEEYDNKNN